MHPCHAVWVDVPAPAVNVVLTETVNRRSMKENENGWRGMNYTYIVECNDKTLYTGWTTDLEKRLQAHNTGKGAKYTRSRRPVQLVYTEESEDRHTAMRREAQIKQMSRAEKLEMIAAYQETQGSKQQREGGAYSAGEKESEI